MSAKFTTNHTLTVVSFVLGTLSIAHCQTANHVASESNDVHKIIASGILHSFDELTIKAKFVFKRGIARSKEEGLNGEFFSPMTGESGTREVANGVFVKLGDSMRCQLNFECPADYNPSNQTYQLLSDDTIIHGRWMVRRVPLQETNSGHTIGNNTTISKQASAIDLNEFSERTIFARYNPVLAPLLISRIASTSKNYSSIAETLDQSMVKITMATSDGRQVESALFSTIGRFPILSRTDGINWTGVSQNIVQLPSGRELAKIYRQTVGPVKVRGYKDPVWIAYSWETLEYTEDVSASDFEIALQFDEEFHGLPRPSDGIVDVFSIADDDPEATKPSEDANNNTFSPVFIRSLWVFLSLALSASIFVWVYRRWFHVYVCVLWIVFAIGCSPSTNGSSKAFVPSNTRLDNKDVTTDTTVHGSMNLGSRHHFGRLFVHSSSPEERALQCAFTIKNNTANQIQLTIDGTTCGCVIPRIGQSTLDMNDETDLSMSFYPPLLPGYHQQSVFLTTHDNNQKSRSQYKVEVEVYPRLACPAAISSVPLLDESGESELRIVAFSDEAFDDDLIVNCDVSRVSVASKCILAETWDSIYCRQWSVSIKKLETFKDGVTLLSCTGNGSTCSLQLRDKYKAFDVSCERVFMKRDFHDFPILVTVTPVNAEVLGEISYNLELLEVRRIDNLNGTTDLQIFPRHHGTQFHTHIELFQPFSENSDGSITVSCL